MRDYDQAYATRGEETEDRGPSALGELEQHLETLDAQVRDLALRLTGVLLPEYATEKMDGNAPAPQVSLVRSLVNDVVRITSRIVDIKERLEV